MVFCYREWNLYNILFCDVPFSSLGQQPLDFLGIGFGKVSGKYGLEVDGCKTSVFRLFSTVRIALWLQTNPWKLTPYKKHPLGNMFLGFFDLQL
jgi:hypothetical protein